MEELDTEWIDKYEDNERDFIKNSNIDEVPVKKLNIYSLYINKKNELEKIKVTDLDCDLQVLKKEKLLTLIKSKSIDENIRYKLIGLLKYNIELKHDELYKFISKKCNPSYLESITNIDDIIFNSGLEIFEDMHSLFLIYLEKTKYNITKKNTQHSTSKTRKNNL